MEAVEKLRHLERGGIRLLVERQIAAFQRAGDGLGQLARARKMRKPLGEAADLVFGDAQDFGHFGKSTAGLEGRKAADDRGTSRTVFFEN